ncbi:MAG: hypothetical protein Kow0080_17330 [Candidatus Promineifilaceae bacterium]
MYRFQKINLSQKAGLVILIAAVYAMTAVFLLAQEVPTATPDAVGVIYAQVQPGDTLWAIAARHQLTLQQLLDFNNLAESDFIQPGDVLIVGYGTPPATATPLPSPTATFPPPPPPATAVPPPPTGVCLLAFLDQNENGVYEAGEPLQANVAITIYNETAVVANYTTDGQSEPYCLDTLAPGRYRVTRSFNQALGEYPTTDSTPGLVLAAGQMVQLALGAAASPEGVPALVQTAAAPTAAPPSATLPPTATPSPQTQPPAPRAATPFWVWLLAGLLVLAAGVWGYGRLRTPGQR